MELLRRDRHDKGGGDKCYELASNDREGRHLVASRDISEGEVILRELPITAGPDHSTKPVCLGCYKRVDGSIVCRRCSWPLCSQECEASTDHKDECDFFSGKSFRPEIDSNDPDPLYDAISPLRVLLLKSSDPEGHAAFAELQTHVQEWNMDPDWAKEHEPVFEILRRQFGLDNLTFEELLAIYGAFYTNDFSVRVDDGVDGSGCHKIRLAFGLVSMLSNDCSPNTWRSILGRQEGYMHQVVAKRPISKGQTITINYEDFMLPNVVRRERLLHGKKFECHCERCSDPTEMGTGGSSLVCPKCKQVMEQQTKEATSDWRCRNCNHVTSYLKAKELVFKWERRMDALLGDPSKCGVEEYEAALREAGRVLHGDNMIMVRVKYSLCGMYGRVPGYEMHQMTKAATERKKQLCDEVLRVLDKVDSGISVRRGMVLYERHMPTIMLAQMGRGAGALTPADADKAFARGVDDLRRSIDLLAHEPDGVRPTFERQVYLGARQSLKPLQDFVKKNAF